MENKKAFIISGICVLIAMLLVSAYSTVRQNELTASFGDLVDVVVASKDIPEYGIIESGMVTTTKVFKNYKQPVTVANPEDVVGKSTYVPIARGEQITLTKLVHQDGKPVLDKQVEKKMRAVTVMISPQSGVSRLIRPGNRVDILIAPVYDQGGASVLEVKTLIPNAVVLATGKHIQNEIPTRVDRDLLNYIDEANAKVKRKDLFANTSEGLHTARPDDNYSYVTVQLNTKDAEKMIYLSHAYGDKAIYLTLRNTTDADVAPIPTTILDDVLGPDSDYGRSKRRPPPITPPKPRYNDILGGQEIPRY